mgnify:FL=1
MKAEILHVWKALHYSTDGLIATFRNETAFRLELIMAVVLIPIALILPLKGIEKVMLIGSVLLVLVVELLNTAIESVVDRISEETHHLSKTAKDAGSAAVFISLVILGITWFTLCSSIYFESDVS